MQNGDSHSRLIFNIIKRTKVGASRWLKGGVISQVQNTTVGLKRNKRINNSQRHEVQ